MRHKFKKWDKKKKTNTHHRWWPKEFCFALCFVSLFIDFHCLCAGPSCYYGDESRHGLSAVISWILPTRHFLRFPSHHLSLSRLPSVSLSFVPTRSLWLLTPTSLPPMFYLLVESLKHLQVTNLQKATVTRSRVSSMALQLITSHWWVSMPSFFLPTVYLHIINSLHRLSIHHHRLPYLPIHLLPLVPVSSLILSHCHWPQHYCCSMHFPPPWHLEASMDRMHKQDGSAHTHAHTLCRLCRSRCRFFFPSSLHSRMQRAVHQDCADWKLVWWKEAAGEHSSRGGDTCITVRGSDTNIFWGFVV